MAEGKTYANVHILITSFYTTILWELSMYCSGDIPINMRNRRGGKVMNPCVVFCCWAGSPWCVDVILA